MHVNRDICRYLLVPVNIFLSVNNTWSCILHDQGAIPSPLLNVHEDEASDAALLKSVEVLSLTSVKVRPGLKCT